MRLILRTMRCFRELLVSIYIFLYKANILEMYIWCNMIYIYISWYLLRRWYLLLCYRIKKSNKDVLETFQKMTIIVLVSFSKFKWAVKIKVSLCNVLQKKQGHALFGLYWQKSILLQHILFFISGNRKKRFYNFV